jgi:type IV secretion system protein VirB9
MKRILTLATVLALYATGPALADDRIQELEYDPTQVVRVDACLGYQTMIEFAPDERIENVGVGDASQWLVVPNARADLLFVRPAFATTRSNMTVATSRRRYAFELSAAQTAACARGDVLYYLRFRYADAGAPTTASSDVASVQVKRFMQAPEFKEANWRDHKRSRRARGPRTPTDCARAEAGRCWA